MEGPASEEAERRAEALARGEQDLPSEPDRRAVFGSTDDDPQPHFLGWLEDVDPDELFASGAAWGIQIRRTAT